MGIGIVANIASMTVGRRIYREAEDEKRAGDDGQGDKGRAKLLFIEEGESREQGY